jgi:hypothetical protein
MEKVTLSVSREIKEKLDQYPEVNWTEVLRGGIKEKIRKLKKFQNIEGEL